MAQLSLVEEPSQRLSWPGRGLLFVGVAAAALMGVGMGLWARPAMNERGPAVAQARAIEPAPLRTLQIVVEDNPAPLGALIEVLPALDPPRKVVLPQRLPPEPMAPVRRDSGLVRVQAVEPALEPEPEPDEAPAPPTVARKPAVAKAVTPLAATAPMAVAPKAVAPKALAPRAVVTKAVAPKAPAPKAVVTKTVAPKVVAPKAVVTKAAAPKAPTPKAVTPKVLKVATPKAKANPAKIEKARIEKAKVVEKAKARPPTTSVAKAAPPKERARLAKAERREKAARVEKAELKKPTKPNGLDRAVQHTATPKAKPAPKLQTAQIERKKAKAPKPRVEKAIVKAKPARVEPPKAIRPARGAGPLRVAKAAPRPDTTINDADRQMNRAYSTARAAGVPDWQLRRQQQRWAQARASAAREAPWAVHDVYLARIAELHDLTRDAQGSGY